MWIYNSITEKLIDMAGKHRISAVIKDGEKEEIIMVKFQTEPTEEEIIREVNKICEFKNQPEPKLEPTIEELKNQIEKKDAKITELIDEINKLKNK